MAQTVIVCHLQDCPAYRNREKPMRVIGEKHTTWIFQCPVCLNVRGIAKAMIGGTRGQGAHDHAGHGMWGVSEAIR